MNAELKALRDAGARLEAALSALDLIRKKTRETLPLEVADAKLHYIVPVLDLLGEMLRDALSPIDEGIEKIEAAEWAAELAAQALIDSQTESA